MKREVKKSRVDYGELVRKSIAASVLIGLGNYILLKMGEPLGPVLFAFGLLGVCVLGLNLFTGKCGFLIEDKIHPLDLILILAVNLLAGYLLGIFFSICDGGIVEAAASKVAGWEVSWAFLGKSVLCGVIMYLAVAIYRKGSKLGVLFGVPLFIFCGFQHCIANVITLGVAHAWDWSLLLAIVGNFVGALAMWGLVGYNAKEVRRASKKR